MVVNAIYSLILIKEFFFFFCRRPISFHSLDGSTVPPQILFGLNTAYGFKTSLAHITCRVNNFNIENLACITYGINTKKVKSDALDKMKIKTYSKSIMHFVLIIMKFSDEKCSKTELIV